MESIPYEVYQHDGILIDLETPALYKQWHLPDAKNIPFDELLYQFPTLLKKDETYYFYCRHGNKSRRIVQTLLLYGYHAKQLKIPTNM